ncbi:YfhD family protein [Ectobacillus polymachus]
MTGKKEMIPDGRDILFSEKEADQDDRIAMARSNAADERQKRLIRKEEKE